MDKGTENVQVADLQMFFSERNEASVPPYIFGRSLRNQRIEKFWQFCYTHFAIFWKDLFKDLEMTGIYIPSDPLQRDLLQFCFMPILKSELAHLKDTWNSHKVRKMNGTECPSGIPEALYSTPEYYGGYDGKNPIDANLVDTCADIFCTSANEYGCNDEAAELFLEIMLMLDLSFPDTWLQGLDLYAVLRDFTSNA